MTAQECINYIDAIEPNAYTSTQKLGWLSECEGKVYAGLFLVQPDEFTPITDGSRTLALPAPYDRIYPRYLQAMIHFANGEYDRYANSMAVFNEAWNEANRWLGGDYDVTDRLRNRRFEAEIAPEPGEQTILDIPEGCAIAAGRIVVRQAFVSGGTATGQLALGGGAVASVDLTAAGATATPMLLSGAGGTTLSVNLSGTWTAAGAAVFTGRLLIPDEKWSYAAEYADRRDARWHG